MRTYNHLSNRTWMNLCHISDDDITRASVSQTKLGAHEFNYLSTYDQVAKRVAQCFTEATGRQVAPSHI